jgi:hypothetical protein
LREVGIDVNCAPLADVARDVTHPVLLNRLYGRDPETVAAVARAVADGLMAGGVVPVLKHLPGYGLGVVDSHEDLPRVRPLCWRAEGRRFRRLPALADLPLGHDGAYRLRGRRSGRARDAVAHGDPADPGGAGLHRSPDDGRPVDGGAAGVHRRRARGAPSTRAAT